MAWRRCAITDEDEYFPPPRNIRELQAAVEVAATAMPAVARGATGGRRPGLAASDVLAALRA